MAKCSCSYCESNKTISTLRQTDPPQRHKDLTPRQKYPAKTIKVWRDRVNSERKQLIDAQARLADRKEDEKTCKHRWGRYTCSGLNWEEYSVKYHLKNIAKLTAEADRMGIVL